MPRGRRKPAIPCNQRSGELFRKRNVSGVVGRQVLTVLPDTGQENEVWIPHDPEVNQILNRDVGPLI